MTHRLNREKRVLEVTLAGDLLSTNVAEIKKGLYALMDSEGSSKTAWDHLELDLRAARMVDSTGLNLLVSLVRILRGEGKAMRVRIASTHVDRAFRFTRMNQLAEVTLQ